MISLIKNLLPGTASPIDEVEDHTLRFVRLLVFRLAAVLTPLAVLPSAIYYWYAGPHLLAAFESVLFILLIFNTWYLWIKNRFIFSPLALLLISFLVMIITIIFGIPEFIYFCFAFPVAFYLMVDRQVSFYLSIFWWATCSFLSYMYLPLLESFSFALSLASIAFFLEVLYTILNGHEQKLKQLAVRDPLTNAFNRRVMEETMLSAIKLHRRYNHESSIVVIDIDHFKPINDHYGHKEGDRALKNLVKTIEARLRDTDRLCRFGGEEFVAILPNTDRQHAFDLAQMMREAIREAELSPEIRITVSCGVAQSQPEDTVTDWLHRGDIALYRAKELGRDRVEIERPGDS